MSDDPREDDDMDGINPEAATAAVREGLRELLGNRDLEAWVEVRDPATGETIYSFRAASPVRLDDEVTVVHRIGGVEISAT